MHLMPFDPAFELIWGHQLGNKAKSVQECLRTSISLVAPYVAKVPTNPKITSQTTSRFRSHVDGLETKRMIH